MASRNHALADSSDGPVCSSNRRSSPLIVAESSLTRIERSGGGSRELTPIDAWYSRRDTCLRHRLRGVTVNGGRC
jgi:hypothetical protein